MKNFLGGTWLLYPVRRIFLIKLVSRDQVKVCCQIHHKELALAIVSFSFNFLQVCKFLNLRLGRNPELFCHWIWTWNIYCEETRFLCMYYWSAFVSSSIANPDPWSLRNKSKRSFTVLVQFVSEATTKRMCIPLQIIIDETHTLSVFDAARYVMAFASVSNSEDQLTSTLKTLSPSFVQTFFRLWRKVLQVRLHSYIYSALRIVQSWVTFSVVFLCLSVHKILLNTIYYYYLQFALAGLKCEKWNWILYSGLLSFDSLTMRVFTLMVVAFKWTPDKVASACIATSIGEKKQVSWNQHPILQSSQFCCHFCFMR